MGNFKHMLAFDLARAAQRSKSAGGPHQRQFSAQAVNADHHAKMSRIGEHIIRHIYCLHTLLPARDLLDDLVVFGLPCFGKAFRIAFLRAAATHDLDAFLDFAGRAYVNGKSEAIKQLRAQFAFFRVSASDQHEPGAVAHGQPFALDHILT